MSTDAQGRIDIDVDFLIKIKNKYPDPNEAHKYILKELKKSLKDIEIVKSQTRAIKINMPEFTIDIAIIDKFSDKNNEYILTRDLNDNQIQKNN